jgi:drug/metabolite transporter (DMT)-like permease
MPRVSERTSLGLGLLVLYICWGSSFLGIEKAVSGFPPLTSVFIRFLSASLILASFIAWRSGWRSLLISRGAIFQTVSLGVLMLTLGNGGVSLAQSRGMPSWLAALVIATVPIWVVLLRLIFRDRVSQATLIGTVIAFAGTCALLLSASKNGEVPSGSLILAFIGALGWSIGSFLASRTPQSSQPMISGTHHLFFAALGIFVALLFTDEPSQWQNMQPDAAAIVGLIWLIVAGSSIGLVVFNWIVTKSSVSIGNTYAFSNPVIATLLAVTIVHNRPSQGALVSIPFVVLGVAMIIFGDKKVVTKV